MTRKMKNSGVEWIGEIPEEWTIRRLKFLCSIKTGNKDTVNAKDDGEYPFYVRSPKIERIDSYTFDGEAVLTAGDGVGAGKVFHYVNGKFDYHQRVYNLHDFQNVEGKYLYYYLKENFIKEIEKSNAKSTVDSIRLPMLLNFLIVLPSDKEQIKITSYLDNKCSQIDKTIEKEKQVIEKLKEYKESVITEAVTKGLNHNVKMKDSGVEWIGGIPEDWKVVRIKNILVFNPTYSENLNDDDFVSFVPMECLKNNRIESKVAQLSKVKGGYTYFANDDVIMAKVTPCFENGNIAVAQGLTNNVGFGSSELYVFRCTNSYTRYIFYYLQNNIFKQRCISTMYGTGGLKRVSSSFVFNYKLAIPTKEQQKEIADYLDKKCSSIDKLISDKEKVIEKLTEYKKSLIYECVTGKREVQ